MEIVTTFVIKIASRCNLNCSYCYMYNMGDKTYLNQPKFMSLDIVRTMAKRLKEYAEECGLDSISLVFHGGEPLLLKQDYYRQFFKIIKEEAPSLKVTYLIQTNGVTLDQSWYDLFTENKVIVGISMDGPKEFHDKYRVNHKGQGSYEEVLKAIQLGNDNNLSGIIMVMNSGIPAKDLYAEMKKTGAKRWNLLFPDGHYQNLSFGFDSQKFGNDDHTPYADWLIELYKIWKQDKERPSIYLIETLVRMVMGDSELGDQLIGSKSNGVLVIETDGSIEIVDSIRACYEGITRNNLNVVDNDIKDLFEDKVFNLYYNSHQQVCEKCLNCPILEICGGGFVGHRYSIENGFDNPTIYCKDMIKFITFLRSDILESLPKETTEELQLDELSYEDVLAELDEPPKIKIDDGIKETLNSFSQPLKLTVL